MPAAEIWVWPKTDADLLSTKRGFVIGWRESDASWPTETIIVAGLIALQDDKINSLLVQKEHSALRFKIEGMKGKCCYCCHCGNGDSNKSSCKRELLAPISSSGYGCTSRNCFEGLDVVAFLDKSGAASVEDHNLPLITLSPRGYPIIRRRNNDSVIALKQIVLYDQNSVSIDKEFALFRHCLSPDDSFFSRNLLFRLTHASAVLETLHQTQSTTAAPTRRHNHHNKDDSKSVQTNKEHNLMKSIQLFLEANSLFARHFIHGGQRERRCVSPALDVARHLLGLTNTHSAPAIHCCLKCSNGCFFNETRYKMVERAVVNHDGLVLASVDTATGALVSLALLYIVIYHPIDQSLPTAAIKLHFQFLSEGLQWLQRFPLGFKLNESMMDNVGREIQRLWNVHEWIALRLVESSANLLPLSGALFSLASMLLGGSGFSALLFDVSRLLTLHVSVLAWFTLRVYAFELYLLAAMWRLFRGKKQNILRHRTDTMDYDYMQLLLGTVVFAVALFLFTTVFVYHAFFTILHLAAVMVMNSFAFLYIFLQFFPWGSLWLRRCRPGFFTREVFLIDLEDEAAGGTTATDVTHLGIRPHSYASIFAGTVIPLVNSLLFWYISFIAGSLVGLSASRDVLDSIFPCPLQSSCTK